MLLCDKIVNFTKNEMNNKGFMTNFKANRLINGLEKEWASIMANLGLYNKLTQTYSLNNVEITEYGYKCDIFIVHGLNFSKLDSNRDIIQENLGCMLLLNHSKTSNFISARFIFNQNDNLAYQLLEEKCPYQLYVGNDYSGKPIYINVKDYPHLLITGGTRSGKSKMTDVILTNLIANCNPSETMLFLIQVAKSDLVLYEDAIHTRAFCDTLQKSVTALEYIVNTIMIDRDNIIRPYRKKALVNNIYDYNKLNKTDKLPTIHVVFDEMSSLYQNDDNDAESKKLKQRIKYLTDRIAQYGAGLAINLIMSLQRPTKENLSSFVKSQATALISFRQNNSKSSEVATDDAELALGLKQREFIYKTDKWNYGIVPLVNDKVVYELIKPKLKPFHRDLFQDLGKLKNRCGVKKSREKIECGSHLTPTEKEILEKNISKIDGYVPYENQKGLNIVKGREKIK